MSRPKLIPAPSQLDLHEGYWTLDRETRFAAEGEAAIEAGKLAEVLAQPLGWRLPIVPGSPRAGDVLFSLEAARADLGQEGYELQVAADRVHLIARNAAGLFYAGQTLRQLLPEAAWRRAPAEPDPWRVPCLRIVDQPRFSWRGLLLDPARHFIHKAALLSFIDALAMHKLNRLQLHLTDDQGWRLELRSFPRLTARAAWRDGTVIGHLSNEPLRDSQIPHGGFYSQADVREIVAYAAARHIVVVPEIEMPGHAGAWLAAYPEFAVFPERAAHLDVRRRWGISPDILAPRPATLEACRRILDEVCDLFPSPWIHIGGDEAPRDQWRQSQEMQEHIRALGLRNEDELQAWFTTQLSHHLAAKGRRLVGWDEILDGAALGGQTGQTALATNAIAMAWRGWLGQDNQRTAARAGHDTIMASTESTYLDHYQGPPAEEPLAIGGALSLAHVYAYDPAPSTLPDTVARHIVGAQGQVWGEYLAHSDAVGYMAFPRACALAEVCWSPSERKDLIDFLARLEAHEGRLRALGLPHRPLARRTSLPESSGRILCPAADAMIHGTEVVRQPDGALSRWSNPETVLSWRAHFAKAGLYRARLLIQSGSGDAAPFQLMVAGQQRQPARPEELDFAVFDIEQPGPRLVFLRAVKPAPAEGYAVVQGLELTPAE